MFFKRGLSARFFAAALAAVTVTAALSCKSPPPQPDPPVVIPEPEEPAPTAAASLMFNGIEAASTAQVSLHYTLNVENTGTAPFTASVRGWRLTLNETAGAETVPGTVLYAQTVVDIPAAEAVIAVEAGGTAQTELRLDLNLAKFPGWKDQELTDYDARLTLDLVCAAPAGRTAGFEAMADAGFPRIREPEFTITGIAVMQAELINTRFKVAIKIDNPNFFPVELSSFEYTLYGDGLLWADGAEKKVLQIPAGQSEQKELFLTMNFIGMKRDLLDDVINMDYVNYRFSGGVQVDTGVAWLPSFHAGFDKTGYSEVLK